MISLGFDDDKLYCVLICFPSDILCSIRTGMKNYIKQNKDQVREQAQATSIAVKRTSSLEDVD